MATLGIGDITRLRQCRLSIGQRIDDVEWSKLWVLFIFSTSMFHNIFIIIMVLSVDRLWT